MGKAGRAVRTEGSPPRGPQAQDSSAHQLEPRDLQGGSAGPWGGGVPKPDTAGGVGVAAGRAPPGAQKSLGAVSVQEKPPAVGPDS